MDTAVIDLAKVFSNLQKQVDRIRNICILAHVDHGKTTLADSLVASNGIISKRMAGKLRYMDCRADEQERGITMKSSSIALYYRRIGQQMENESRKDYLINLIDSPGHVDFSNEVSTAVRLCDGALLVVDVVEGVCPQTRACLQQIYEEQLKPILIFNKIDRLILEKQLTPLDAYYHMVQLLEQVNAALGSIFATDVMAKENLMNADNYESGLEHCDDSNLYFNPSTGNVIFCSAYDGWGFTLHDFVSTYSKLLEIPTEELQNNLWGDFYYNGKKKCVTAGAQAKAKKPMFVQFVLENIWNLYDIIAIKRDKEKIPIIAQKLHIVVHNRDIRGNDVRLQLKLILGQWLPIERTVLEMVIKHMPAPIHMTKERAQNLLFNRNANLNSYPEESLQLIDDFVKCDANSDRIVIFVSKMSIVPVTQLPHLKPKRLTQEELKAKRNEVVKRLEEKHRREAGEIAQELQNVITGVEKLTIKGNEEEHLEQQQQEQKRHCDLPASDNLKNKEEPLLSRDHIHEAVENVDSAYNVQKVEIEEKSNFEFIAFARIFSGTVRKGQKLYSLTPKHDPRNHNHMNLDSSYITEVTIGDLYVFMGAELLAVDEVPSGNIVGIGGLEQYIIKTGTLSNTIFCSAFSELNCTAQPILRIAIEAENPSQMPQLIKGLKMLNQADACVHVSIETNGEHVITTLGEVHAEKCIRDLEENYAKCKVHVSEPIVSFRETIVPESHKDMVNEIVTKKISNEKTLDKKIVRMQTTDKMCTIKVIALPLPQQIIDIFEKYQRFFSDLHAMNITTATTTTGPSATAMITRTSISNKSQQIIMQIRRQLVQAFAESFDGQGVVQLSDKELLDCIWSLGPKHCGSNILLNLTDYKQPDFWQIQSNRLNYINDDGNQLLMDKRHHYNNAFINGFQITTLNGPLCEEPMQGVCFVVLEWSLAETFNEDFNCKSFGPFSGQLLNAVKDACRQAFLNQPQRLVTPIYTCNIIVNSDVLGKMYAVLGKRHGKIVSADLMQGSGNFFVTAMLPVIGSFNFAQEIRKQTSGLAYPQLVFSHWEVIDIDPFWVPTTEEEFTHFGEKADSVNRAKLYMNRVRRRKGLPVDDKVVEHAEKQRTLAKKK